MTATQTDNPRMNRPAPPAFTLIELLTVIAIISLLVGILLPALGQVTALSRLATCQANIRSQLQAHAVYADQNDGCKPPLMRQGRSTVRTDCVSPDVKWSGDPVGQGILVKQGLLSIDCLFCPDLAMRQDVALDREGWETLSTSGSSYAYFWRRPDGAAAAYDSARQTGRTALVMDINCLEGKPYQGEYLGRAWLSHPVCGKINIGYVGGHVKTRSNREIVLKFPAGAYEELEWFDQANAVP